MRYYLYTCEFPPFKGGVANYYGNLVKHWSEATPLQVLEYKHGEKPLKTLNKDDYLLVGHILPLGTQAYIWSWLRGFKYGVFLHGMDFSFSQKKFRKRLIGRLILQRAAKVICANSYTANLVKTKQPSLAAKIVVLNPGLEFPRLQTNLEIKDRLLKQYNLQDQKVFLSIGRLVKRKGFDKTIQALALQPRLAEGNFKYIIIGSGPEEKYLKDLIPADLKNKIIFIDTATDEEKTAWFALCDLFIMPARNIDGDFEGFGIVYLEANAAGRPVIAGLAGGVSDAVKDGSNGLMVDPEDPQAIRSAISQLINNKELAQKLGLNGQEFVKNFDWVKLAERLKIVYDFCYYPRL